VILNGYALDQRRFTDDQCDALFEAILVDDVVDPHTELPPTIRLDYHEDLLADCFRLSRQLWKTSVSHGALVELFHKLMRDRTLTPEDQLRFKHARAKLKNLRFAHALYDERHRYPVMMNWVTTAMGHLQDAFKNKQSSAVARQVMLSRFFLTALPQRVLTHEIDHLVPTSSAGFRHYTELQVARLRAVLAKEAVTGHEFHETRKIISRQVAFYNSLVTIAPSREDYMVSRSLIAINGLMGSMHDDLIEHRIAGTSDYYRDRFVLPEEIRQRLQTLVTRFM
jgi:hypothetical protein